jgi:hypothetical protein
VLQGWSTFPFFFFFLFWEAGGGVGEQLSSSGKY